MEPIEIDEQFVLLVRRAQKLIKIPRVKGILDAIRYWQTKHRRRQPVNWICVKILARRIAYIRHKKQHPPQHMFSVTPCGPREAFWVKG